jgi:hypothetical protein
MRTWIIIAAAVLVAWWFLFRRRANAGAPAETPAGQPMFASAVIAKTTQEPTAIQGTQQLPSRESLMARNIIGQAATLTTSIATALGASLSPRSLMDKASSLAPAITGGGVSGGLGMSALVGMPPMTSTSIPRTFRNPLGFTSAAPAPARTSFFNPFGGIAAPAPAPAPAPRTSFFNPFGGMGLR